MHVDSFNRQPAGVRLPRATTRTVDLLAAHVQRSQSKLLPVHDSDLHELDSYRGDSQDDTRLLLEAVSYALRPNALIRTSAD
ncbi:MAG TPA: hypothetical protein DDW52_22270 [Planctomycetaceae bacterium]|nr:hypothetical protein [Planctomycetaceae bacterium]